MNTYTYTGNYCNIEVQETLPEEGILNGQFGTLHFKRCCDGYAIYDTSFLGSGFVNTPSSANIAYPSCINGIPVTEIHRQVKTDRANPIAVEGGNIKRVYLSIVRKKLKDSVNQEDSLERFVAAMFDAMEGNRQEQNPLEISIDFYKEGRSVGTN